MINEERNRITDEVILSKILNIRGLKVMIDSDLADLYGLPTKRLNEQVKRNLKRFPKDFMFQLTEQEKAEVVAICDHLKKLKYSSSLPNAFTEHGAVMLASILNSDRAILVNIKIVRVFNGMRQLLKTHSEILRKLEQLEEKDLEQDRQILLIFEYLKQLEKEKNRADEQAARKRIGFRPEE
jgi:hypothetical protein